MLYVKSGLVRNLAPDFPYPHRAAGFDEALALRKMDSEGAAASLVGVRLFARASLPHLRNLLVVDAQMVLHKWS